jgi:putative transposase
MTNHFHLLLETPDANLSKAIHQFNSVYTQAFNRRHGRVGHVLQGRFKSIVVDWDAYLLELCRYIVLNPVRAGMVKEPGKYPWSSYRATAGLGKKPNFLAVDWIREQFGTDRVQARKEYRLFVKSGLRMRNRPGMTSKDSACSETTSFSRSSFPLLKDKSAWKEIPRVQRFADRPALEDILHGIEDRTQRDAAIFKACQEHWIYPNANCRCLMPQGCTIQR